jgi:hypothetical protein
MAVFGRLPADIMCMLSFNDFIEMAQFVTDATGGCKPNGI